jgi:NAD(P) transhydrogenase subunit alpha
MRVVVPSEIRPGEKRVALVPDVVSKLTKLGHEVLVQSGAGVHSQASDNEFTAAGAQVVNGDVLAGAEVVLSVSSLTPQQMSQLKRGAVTISFSLL